MSSEVAPIEVDRRSATEWQTLARPRHRRVAPWELVTIVVGVVAACAAVTITLRADFLAYPGWLAVQKADLILGPIGVGLYWQRRRPQSLFGPMLIALGFVHVPYIAQSSSDSALFTFGVHWEGVIYLATLAVILAFPSGRLRRPDRLILVAAALAAVVPSSAIWLFSPQISARASISACAAACPPNALLISSKPSVVERLIDVDRAAIIMIALATAALLVWRIATGTTPQRRALAIGTPIALVFLLTQAAYQATIVLGGDDLRGNAYVRWILVGTRLSLWYGFLIALVVAELFAGRVLRMIVRESLRRPSLGELAELLRKPLDDPRLQLGFWQPQARVWTDGEGVTVEPPAPGSGRALTEVDRDGAPAVAIVHDRQLAEDPELLRAAGQAAMLALENAELQAAWSAALTELKDSRARIAAGSARERRSLEQDLHDGVQEALVALRIKLTLATEETAHHSELQQRLRELGDNLDAAIAELRDLAQGIYPSLLAEVGLIAALKAVARRASRTVEVTGDNVGRYPPEIESALYYCCREALQNAVRHAGPDTHVSIHLCENDGELRFEVRDHGHGFEIPARFEGGLRNIQDRIGALDGSITFKSLPGDGAVVSGAVPLGR